MGDFVGAVLEYLRRHPVPRLTIGAGIAKAAKLASGHLDLLPDVASRVAGPIPRWRLLSCGGAPVAVDVVVVDRAGVIVGRAGPV